MEKRTRVIVYGNSLHMAGMATSLKAEMCLEVVCIDPHSLDVRESLSKTNSLVILFDLSDPDKGLDIALLREQPDLLLIGVDPCSDELLVLSNKPTQALKMTDLVNIIRQKD